MSVVLMLLLAAGVLLLLAGGALALHGLLSLTGQPRRRAPARQAPRPRAPATRRPAAPTPSGCFRTVLLPEAPSATRPPSGPHGTYIWQIPLGRGQAGS